MWDHPRACGEHRQTVKRAIDPAGSSPRLRGTRLPRGRHGQNRGIIPALAGNTYAHSRTDASCRDHPRACGEHLETYGYTDNNMGSSPRLRGTRTKVGRLDIRLGIIPALAGNTCSPVRSGRVRGDHPRACGEHRAVELEARDDGGSSPRLRGTLAHVVVQVVALGIIPALAGNTTSTSMMRCGNGDHPRACGEHTMKSQ